MTLTLIEFRNKRIKLICNRTTHLTKDKNSNHRKCQVINKTQLYLLKAV